MLVWWYPRLAKTRAAAARRASSFSSCACWWAIRLPSGTDVERAFGGTYPGALRQVKDAWKPHLTPTRDQRPTSCGDDRVDHAGRGTERCRADRAVAWWG